MGRPAFGRRSFSLGGIGRAARGGVWLAPRLPSNRASPTGRVHCAVRCGPPRGIAAPFGIGASPSNSAPRKDRMAATRQRPRTGRMRHALSPGQWNVSGIPTAPWRARPACKLCHPRRMNPSSEWRDFRIPGRHGLRGGSRARRARAGGRPDRRDEDGNPGPRDNLPLDGIPFIVTWAGDVPIAYYKTVIY